MGGRYASLARAITGCRHARTVTVYVRATRRFRDIRGFTGWRGVCMLHGMHEPYGVEREWMGPQPWSCECGYTGMVVFHYHPDVGNWWYCECGTTHEIPDLEDA